mmetsp:Transcript_6833/g.13630  ORF Transcript_6833/g.13630 Transcript_6833/m.13630 type:complete len:394 (+) Transcript_6833:526-1707(+)
MDTDNNKELKDVKYQSSKSLRIKMASILKASGDFDTLSEIEARVSKGGDVFKVKMGEDISLDKEVDRIACEVERNSDAAIWLLNVRAKLAMTKALTLNDGFAKEDMKSAATNFCALPNIVNRIEAIRGEGGPKKLFGEVTRLSILGSVKYKSCELEDDQKDTNENFSQILETLREEIEENKPTMSKKEPINFTANDKRSQEEQGLRSIAPENSPKLLKWLEDNVPLIGGQAFCFPPPNESGGKVVGLIEGGSKNQRPHTDAAPEVIAGIFLQGCDKYGEFFSMGAAQVIVPINKQRQVGIFPGSHSELPDGWEDAGWDNELVENVKHKGMVTVTVEVGEILVVDGTCVHMGMKNDEDAMALHAHLVDFGGRKDEDLEALEEFFTDEPYVEVFT